METIETPENRQAIQENDINLSDGRNPYKIH